MTVFLHNLISKAINGRARCSPNLVAYGRQESWFYTSPGQHLGERALSAGVLVSWIGEHENSRTGLTPLPHLPWVAWSQVRCSPTPITT